MVGSNYITPRSSACTFYKTWKTLSNRHNTAKKYSIKLKWQLTSVFILFSDSFSFLSFCLAIVSAALTCFVKYYKKIITINNGLEIQKQVNTKDTIFRRFRDLVTPFDAVALFLGLDISPRSIVFGSRGPNRKWAVHLGTSPKSIDREVLGESRTGTTGNLVISTKLKM